MTLTEMNIKKIRIRSKISVQEAVSCVFVLWLLNPITHDYLSPAYVIVIAAMWYFTVNSQNKSAMGKALNSKAFIFAWFYPLFMLIYVAAGHAKLEKSSIGMPLIVLFYMYCYYRNNKKDDSLILKSSIFYFILMASYTLLELKKNPYISRLLANGDKVFKADFLSPLTAGYTEIYYLVFFVISAFGAALIYKKRNFRYFYALLIALLLFLFIRAQYTIAILLVLLGTALAWFTRYRNKSVWLVFVNMFFIILLMFLIFGTDSLAEFVYLVSDMIPDGILKNRVIQIGDLFYSGNPMMQGRNGAVVRFQLYSKSWNTFLSNFFFGVGDSEMALALVGGHSTFIDRLARYGIFGGGLYIISRIYILILVRKTISDRWKRLYSINMVIFLLLSILNTSNRNSFLMMLIVILPLFFECIEEKLRIESQYSERKENCEYINDRERNSGKTES